MISPEPRDYGPLRIHIRQPAGLPTVRVAHFETDGRLWRSVKDRYSFTLNLVGRSEWWVRGRTYEGGPEALTLKAPGELHRELRRDGPAVFQVVSFDAAMVHEALQLVGRTGAELVPGLLDLRHPDAAPLLRLQALLSQTRSEALALEEALAEALAAFARQFTGPSRAKPRRAGRAPVRRAQEYLQAHLDQPVSLTELATHAGLDRFHLCRTFREEMGLPPHAYLTHLRIALAQRLLGKGVAPSEVALQVGLYDQSQLNRHFRRIVGMTPGQYARAAR